MARSRDYKAEYAARNAKARALGFSSYSQLRRSLERGEYNRRIGPAYPAFAKAGFSDEKRYRQERDRAKKWSAEHSKTESSRYVPGMTASQLKAYNDAFVDYRKPWPEHREALKFYLVDVMDYMTDEEFDQDTEYGEAD